MLWKMKRFHLIFIALVLWGDTNGFPVWSRTSVVDQQIGLSNIPCNQSVQPSEVLSRGDGNVKGVRFSSVPLTSEVQNALRDPSSVQSSGGSAHGVSLPYAQSQGGRTTQQLDRLSSLPLRLYRFEAFDAETPGTLVSQSQFSSEPSTATLLTTDPFTTDQGQSLGAFYPGPSSGRYMSLQGQTSPPPSQVSGHQAQVSYRPSTTTQFAAGQSASTSLARSTGASILFQGLTSGSYLTSMGQSSPPSSKSAGFTNQMSGIQSSHKPSTAIPVLTGQSAAAQASPYEAFYPGQASGQNTIVQGQISPSSSHMSGYQAQASYQLGTAAHFGANQSVSTPLAQSSASSVLNEGQTSGTYLTSIGQNIPTASHSAVSTNQLSGFQASYWPSTSTQALPDQAVSTSRAQSSGTSMLYQGLSGSYPASIDRRIPPSSQSAGIANQMSGFQASDKPSTATPVLTRQSTVAQHPSGASNQNQTSGLFSIFQGQVSPSLFPVSGHHSQLAHQPSTTTQFAASQPAARAQVQPSGASILYQGPNSSRYLYSMAQSIPTSNQSVSTNHMSGFQASYQPSAITQALSNQSVPTAQAQSSDDSILHQGLASGSHLTSMGQSIPSCSESAILTNHLSGYQTSYQPTTITQVSAAQSAVSQTPPSGALYPGQTSGQMSGYQSQLAHQPSTATQFPAGQSASTAQAQPSGASILYQRQPSGSYLTTMGQSSQSTAQFAGLTNQLLGFQASYQPSTTTLSDGNSAVAQSSGVSYQSQTPVRQPILHNRWIPYSSQASVTQTQMSNLPSYTTQVLTGQPTSQLQSSNASPLYEQSSRYNLHSQSVPSSIQSEISTNQLSQSQIPSAYQPNAPLQGSTGQSIISQAPLSNRAKSSESAKWYTIMPKIKLASFQSVGTESLISGVQTQPSNQPSSASQLLAAQSAIAQAPFLGVSYPSQTSGRYDILQGQMSPSSSQLSGFQTQSSQPSTTMWFSAGQPASTAQSQLSGASMVNEGPTSGRYLTSLSQNIPSFSQSVAATNQVYGSSSYQPIRTQFSPGQFVSASGCDKALLPASNV